MASLLSFVKDQKQQLALLALMFVSAAIFRPLMPIDETRYLTVAWEMMARENFSLLTVNFAPYHHKPPLLFWWINLFWSVFGVSREAALAAIFVVSSTFLLLVRRLSVALYPEDIDLHQKVSWVLLGSVPFIIYSTLVMFDIFMGVCVLSAFLFFLSHAGKSSWWKVLGGGLCLGAGVLVKGPVAYLYILPPLLLYPLWRRDGQTSLKKWYASLFVAFLVSGLPVGLWLARVAQQSDSGFLYWLIWKQTAGRVSGSFTKAHVRPVYFYLMLSPIMFLPWAFFPGLWQSSGQKFRDLKTDRGSRFLLSAILPAFIAFSFISGKQPHYLVPLLPFILIILTLWLRETRVRVIIRTTLAILIVTAIGQGIAGQTILKKYDLLPVAEYVARNADKDWAYVRNYEGEIGFLGRLRHQMLDMPDIGHVRPWLKEHPDGLAVIRYDEKDNLKGLEPLLVRPYRGNMIGIFRRAEN